MRLDLSALRYLSHDDFRVLTAIEMGMRNHEIVPVELIQSISKIKKVNTARIISNLLKHKLIKHTNVQYDGYSLNYLGYDYLAINSLIKQGILVKIGSKLGVGKESDVFICYVKSTSSEISDEVYNKIKEDIYTEKAKKENEVEQDDNEEDNENEENEEEENEQEVSYFKNDLPKTIQTTSGDLTIAVIKLARLGRTSFRAVKEKRDYIKKQTHYNWLYLSRLSAMNEYKYMTGLFNHKFPVPRPYGYNRHCIVMEYIPSYPLCRIDEIKDKDKIYHQLLDFLLTLASQGLIHGDFNEFNILLNVDNSNDVCVIDFPQMISLDHVDAEKYFNRDVNCINSFFKRKFNLIYDDKILFSEIQRTGYLDRELKAFGCAKEDNKQKTEKTENNEGNEEDEEEDIKDEPLKDNEGFNEDDLDFEKEKKIEEEFNKITVNKENNSKNKKKYTQEDIKEKVKKMINKQGGKTKMGNRFKGKKNIGNKVELKNI